MNKINLLPQELSIGKEVMGVSRVLKKVTVILLAIFVFFGIGLAIFFVLSSQQLSKLQVEASDLETEIKNQERTEQGLVLLKDRLAKIKALDVVESAEKALININPIILSLPPDSELGELSVDSKKITMSARFTTQSSLSSFLLSLENSGSFKKIGLESFSFNPSTGYLVGINFEI